MAKSEPLSIESLLQKQKEEKEAAAKVCKYIHYMIPFAECLLQPRFLTKEQRAQLAIEKRAQEIREQKEKEDLSRSQRDALEKEAEDIRSRERERERAARYGNNGRCEFSHVLPAC